MKSLKTSDQLTMKVLKKLKKIDVDSNRNQFEFRTINYRAISSWMIHMINIKIKSKIEIKRETLGLDLYKKKRL